jgi:predicted transcriptional regulator
MSGQTFFLTQELDLNQAFSVRLDPMQHRALLELAQERKIRRNRLIREAVAFFLDHSETAKPPAA